MVQSVDQSIVKIDCLPHRMSEIIRNIGLGCLSLLMNSVFLIALQKSWKFVKQRRISYHTAHLAFSDAFVGTVTLLHFIVGDNAIGDFFVIAAWTGILSSLLSVSLMAVERALAIKMPHRWTDIFPLKKVFLVMALNWCCTIILAVLMHFYDLVMRFILLVLFYVPIMVTSFMYLYIYFKLWKKNAASPGIAPPQLAKQNSRLYQPKVGSFVVLLTAVLVFTVSPSFLTLAVINACQVFKLECDFLDTITYLSYYFYMLEITNFVVNPIIYVWKMNLYRRAVLRLFGKSTGVIVSDNSVVVYNSAAGLNPLPGQATSLDVTAGQPATIKRRLPTRS